MASERCKVRHDYGQQCRRRAQREVSVFLDPEFRRAFTWAWLPVCESHFWASGYRLERDKDWRWLKPGGRNER